jgi:PIN domain nuclease of toxin-antitoxin system
MYLLDTHTLLWALQRPDLLGEEARQVISREPPNRIFVSPVSAYEVSYKVHRERWPEARRLADHFDQALVDTGFQLASLTTAAAVRAGRLPDIHRDPFDRLLAAVALELDATFLSSDEHVDAFGVRRVW